ncbi:unnamed protein product [Orchesella dallaii]|uniref:HIT-type domain-containing protein n=1 Tax=Orchesella dallaii TaxID=48710 RepID=A0ABP1QR58_9HEXA
MAPPAKSSSPPQELCNVCSSPCKTFCATCKKVYYCCVDHQKQDRKLHKLDCYPAKLEANLDYGGRCFVASRVIKAGELIFKDKALLSGPSGAEVYFHIICLGCYRSVKGNYKCSSCGWPLCSIRCEKLPHHSNNECKIFRDAQVPPCVLKPYQYDFINFLRALLLKNHGEDEGNNGTPTPNKQSWEQLLALESHGEARAGNPFANRLVFEAIEFILKTCKLEGRFEPEVIDHVVGVWTINSFGANPPAGVKPGYARMATLLFPKLCLAAHNCIPNTHGVLKENVKDGNPTYTMELIASSPIPEGGQIHTTYANVCEGTTERREVLEDHYFFLCSCKRCSDPTEFGTYFSSLKCPDCPSGYLLSENPLDTFANWACAEKCGGNSRKYSEFIPKINRIRKEINAADMEYKAEDCIERYGEILETYKEKLLHPNHWLVIDMEFKLMLRISSFLPKLKKEEQSEMLKKLIELAQHCLQIADVIQPGLNSYRGKILYCLVEGRLKQFIRNAPNQGISPTLQIDGLKSMKEQAEEAISILAREDGCDEKQVTMMLTQHIKTIEQMLEVVKKQGKSGGGGERKRN